MSSAIAVREDSYAIVIPDQERELIRKTYGEKLNDLEFQLFIAYAEHVGLDILKGECKAIRFKDVVSYFPTVHGAVKMAGRQGAFDGMDGPYWCGPDGRWTELWLKPEAPAAAKTIVYRKDRAHPTIGIALWEERKQTYFKDGKTLLMPTWAKMPAHMLGKVSKTDALKASGLIGDEPVWIEEDENIEGMDIRVVENQRDTANRRLHGAVASAGLGGHAEARALAAQVRPGTTSLADPNLTASDMHAAADIAENLDHEYVEALIVGDKTLLDAAQAPVVEDFDCDRALWREQIQDALDGDYKATSPQLVKYAETEPWRYIDLIELAPTESFARRYIDKALIAKVDPQEVTLARRHYTERKQIVDEAKNAADPNAVTVATWDEFWKQLKRMNVTTGRFEEVTGGKPVTFGSPQGALDAYNDWVRAAHPEYDPANEAEYRDVVDASTGEIIGTEAVAESGRQPDAPEPAPEKPAKKPVAEFGQKPPAADRHTGA